MHYINEPTTQKLPYFVQFMGGWHFVRSTQALERIIARARHWRGTRIEVTFEKSLHPLGTTDGQTYTIKPRP